MEDVRKTRHLGVVHRFQYQHLLYRCLFSLCTLWNSPSRYDCLSGSNLRGSKRRATTYSPTYWNREMACRELPGHQCISPSCLCRTDAKGSGISQTVHFTQETNDVTRWNLHRSISIPRGSAWRSWLAFSLSARLSQSPRIALPHHLFDSCSGSQAMHKMFIFAAVLWNIFTLTAGTFSNLGDIPSPHYARALQSNSPFLGEVRGCKSQSLYCKKWNWLRLQRTWFLLQQDDGKILFGRMNVWKLRAPPFLHRRWPDAKKRWSFHFRDSHISDIYISRLFHLIKKLTCIEKEQTSWRRAYGGPTRLL